MFKARAIQTERYMNTVQTS